MRYLVISLLFLIGCICLLKDRSLIQNAGSGGSLIARAQPEGVHIVPNHIHGATAGGSLTTRTRREGQHDVPNPTQELSVGGLLAARTRREGLYDVPNRTNQFTMQKQSEGGTSVMNNDTKRSQKESSIERQMHTMRGPAYEAFASVLHTKCGGTTGPPTEIRRLANKLVGNKEAWKFFSHSMCTKIMYRNRHHVWFWHDTRETIDYNKGYDFEKLQKMRAGEVAVDLGANIGDTAALAWKYNHHLQYVSLEPSPYTYIYARWSMLSNHIPLLKEEDLGTGKPGVLLLWGAATNDGRHIVLANSRVNSKHSQVQTAGIGFGEEVPCNTAGECANRTAPDLKQKRRQEEMKWSTIQVPSYSIPALLHKHNVSAIGWLKMDCEGCEYETLIPLKESGLIKNAFVTGEAHYRRISDLSCQERHRQKEPDCQAAIDSMKMVRQLMCYVYRFASCARILQCGLFQEKCYRFIKRPVGFDAR